MLPTTGRTLAGFRRPRSEFVAQASEQLGLGQSDPWRQKVLAACAGLLWRRRLPVTVLRLLHMVGTIPPEQQWQQIALLEGLGSMPDRSPRIGNLRGRGPPRIVTLPTPPEAIGTLRNSSNARLAAAAESLARQLNWPGKDGKALPVPSPLTARHQRLFDLGAKNTWPVRRLPSRIRIWRCGKGPAPARFGMAGQPGSLDSHDPLWRAWPHHRQ